MNRSLALVVALAVALLPGAASARLIPNASGNSFNLTTNPPTADLWCNGGQVLGNGTVKAYTEFCQDYTGSLIPTSTLGTQTLGSSTFPWSAIYAASQVTTGSVTEGTVGTTNASGTGGTAATQNTVNGLSVYGKVAIVGINVSTIVPVNSSYETVVSSGGNLVVTATPSISTTTVVQAAGALGTELASGTYLILSSTSSTGGVTFQDAGTLSGSQLQLGAATRLVDLYNTLVLIYDATDHFWREVSFTSN